MAVAYIETKALFEIFIPDDEVGTITKEEALKRFKSNPWSARVESIKPDDANLIEIEE